MVTLDRDGLIAAIECKDPAFNEALRQEAFRTKLAHIGTDVYLRGLIEISNICRKTLLRDRPHPGESLFADSLGESLRNGRITIGFGRWGDSKHFTASKP